MNTAVRGAPPPARPMRAPAWPRVLAALTVLLIGAATIWVLASSTIAPWGSPGYDRWPTLVAVASVGASTAVAGVIAWTRRPDHLAGLLMTMAAVAWFVGAASWANSGGAAQGYYVLAVAVLVLAYPADRLSGWPARAVVAALAATVIASTILRSLFEHYPYLANCALPDPTCAPIGKGVGTAVTTASHYGTADFGLYNALDDGYRIAILGLSGAAAAIVLLRWVRERQPGRRVLAPSLAMAAALLAAVGLGFLSRQPGFGTDAYATLQLGAVAALVGLPHAFTWDLVRARLDRAGLSDLVVRLGDGDATDATRATLAAALHDPSVRLLVWSPELGGYLDENRRPATLPTGDRSSTCTVLERHGRQLGALVHDPSLRYDASLLASVAAATAIALENARLAGEVRAQLAEVQASRERIAAAADAERRRVERDLHDGAQQRLVALTFRLRAAIARGSWDAALLDDAAAELDLAVHELRTLARGLQPPLLAEAGLAAALESLAERSPIPVHVAAPPGRFPAPIETVAYFVVAEAVTNAVRHGGASEVVVKVEPDLHWLAVSISDDGRGGVDASRGTGLRGLADRVDAAGGRFEVAGSDAGGTVVRAELPLR